LTNKDEADPNNTRRIPEAGSNKSAAKNRPYGQGNPAQPVAVTITPMNIQTFFRCSAIPNPRKINLYQPVSSLLIFLFSCLHICRSQLPVSGTDGKT
jgi:hypothetical protein